MNREQKLRNLILDRYPSLRQFAIESDIPYSTLMTLLSRDVGGASFDIVVKICKQLDIDPINPLVQHWSRYIITHYKSFFWYMLFFFLYDFTTLYKFLYFVFLLINIHSHFALNSYFKYFILLYHIFSHMQYHQKSENKQERSDVICLFNNFESVKIRLENVRKLKKRKIQTRQKVEFGFLVGVTGFEPTTSWSRTKRTTKLCHTPLFDFLTQ